MSTGQNTDACGFHAKFTSRKVDMPDSYCAGNCQNRRTGKNKSLPFYKIPSGKSPIARRQRSEWIRALILEDCKTWSDDKISN